MTMQRDEIYLIDLWRILLREWKLFTVSFVAVVAIASAYAALAQRRWEAQAWVQVGQIATQPGGQDPRPEPFQRVIERLQTVQFQQQVLQDTGIAPNSPGAALYRGSLKIDPSPYSGLIRLSVRAASPGLAKQLAQATVDQLHAIHQRLMAAPLAFARNRLARIQEELAQAVVTRDGLRAATSGAPGPALPASIMMAGKDTEIRELEQARDDLVARLGPSYTFDTSMPWPVYLPERPVSPSLALVIGLGVLGGLGLGLFLAVAVNAHRRASSQPMPSGYALTP